MRPRDAVELIVRAAVTVALLIYTFVAADPSTGPLVVGAVVGYWLHAGETRARTNASRPDDHT